METTHRIIFGNSKDMSALPSQSVDLIVTSPPYPMIAMWDETFSSQNPATREALQKENGPLAFELMHEELDAVWKEVYRVLKIGGLACINIGDAVRTMGRDFRLFPNHSRVLSRLMDIGLSILPPIIWRKQTNAPNKFMGSGMLPAGAYVTLEHEYILILRKGSIREFKSEKEKQRRRQSAIFWEERNIWFSDVWMDLKGTTQDLNDKKIRKRSGAYPFELAYRLINMFSVKGDTVLDPFLGTGTTMSAAMASCRNSLGYELDKNFKDTIDLRTKNIRDFSNQYIRNRIKNHLDFVTKTNEARNSLKYINKVYQFPVRTKQEIELYLHDLESVSETGENEFRVTYLEPPQNEYCEACQL
ncbi:MAG: site-specific DNA-methyltransferase [Deltaproteobacteria bacterium]|nr:site-specific DNA-methyltransferase [Deltaproteobacteria bacterium]